MATTDDTITLEGTFAAAATVHFPGGPTQAATLLGEHRATVVVPAGATVGDLTVETGGVTVGPLPFRHTSFALGLQPFRTSYEQTDGGRQSVPLITARSASTAVVVNGSLYVLGGTNGSGALDTIERALINADGTLGAFSTIMDLKLATPRSGHTTVVVENSLYVLGGTGTTGLLYSVEGAALNPDGSLSSFALIQGTMLMVARTGHTTAIVGNSIYVIGGTQSDGQKLKSIERAVIQPDGSLGPFTIVSNVALTTARSDHTSEVIGNTLYVIGGDAGNGTWLGNIERAAIQPDGSLGPFRAMAEVTLLTARGGHRSAVVGNGLYVLGGTGSGGVSGNIERAPIAADGSLAPFATIPTVTLNSPRAGVAVATIGTFLYIIGGSNGSNSLRTVERASLDADSAVGAFVTSDVALVASRSLHTSTVVRNFLYVIGGQGMEATVQRARISPDGSLSSFTTVPDVTLRSPRDGHATVVIQDFLYVIGGEGNGYQASIERAAISADGSLSPFTVVSGVTLNEGRFGHISVVLGDFLYVIGGYSNRGRLTSIERATINANGTLGAFATLQSAALNTGRNIFTGLVTGGYVYVMGGRTDTVDLTSVERASIAADGSLGTFSAISSGSLFVPRTALANAVVGNAVYVIGGRNNLSTVTTIERATINADGSLGSFNIVVGISLAPQRSSHTATVIGNSLYLIGGDVDILNSVARARLP